MLHCPRALSVSGALVVALAVPALAPTAASAQVRPAPAAAHVSAAAAKRLVRAHVLAQAQGHLAHKPILRRARGLADTPTNTRPTTSAPTAPAATTPAPTAVVPAAVAPVPASGAAQSIAAAVPSAPVDVPVTSSNPFAGKRFSVVSGTEYSSAADAVRAQDPAKAKGLDYLAQQATGFWWGDWNSTATLKADVARHITAAIADGSVPVYVIYDIMKRDSGGYSAGGASSLAAYKAWIDQFVAGVGDNKPLVVVEPDAVNDLYNMTGTARTERAAALTYALTAMKAAGIPAYLDAGGPTIHDPAIAAQLLQEAGVALAQGFSVNVSNFQSTSDDLAWGRAVSALIGGKHFVIDTGRNGNGAISWNDDHQYWCNPPGRALGHAPTSATGVDVVDAFVWIKTPGESDGECRGFGTAGTFSADYAYGLYAASL